MSLSSTCARMAGDGDSSIYSNIYNKTKEEILAKLPQKLVSCLLPFQKDGVVFAIERNGRCLIADEMGLGKTLQAIAVAAYYKEAWPLLIIVPSSLRYVWIEELEKWLPDIHPQQIHLIQGGFDTGGIHDAKVALVTYGLLSSRSSTSVKEVLAARQFQTVICDECHYFKNSRTECWKAVEPLATAAMHCILLSGTPALARPAELFTQISVLLPNKFGSWWSFTKQYCAGHWEYFGKKRQWRADGASNLEELQSRLQTVMIRREKKDVLTQLPEKQRQKILFHLKDSQTKKEILALFSELKPLLKKSKSSLAVNLLGTMGNTADGNPASMTNADGEHKGTVILGHIQQLYKLTGEAKIGPVRDYIQMLCENAHLKFLIFCYHHCMMDGVQEVLWDKKVKFIRIDGSTKPSDRQMYVQQFQNDENTQVAILSILAAGVGLTLTAAKLVVFAELYWTPGLMVQCEDRAHRIGQTNNVPIHYLVAQDTMDEWVWAAVCRKTLVTSAALTGKSQALNAQPGDKFQVELLSSADSYSPEDIRPCQDVDSLLHSQRLPDQKSILDFFMPKSPLRKTASGHEDCRQTGTISSALGSPSDVSTIQPQKKLHTRLKSPVHLSYGSDPGTQSVVFIETSDSDLSEDFQEVPFSLRTRKRKIKTCWGEDEMQFTSHGDSEVFDKTAPKLSGDMVSMQEREVVKVIQTESTRKSSSPISQKGSLRGKSLNGQAAPLVSLSKSSSEEQNELCEQKHQPDFWSCSVCTFSNHSLLPFCEMCNTPRKKKKKAGDMDEHQPGQSNILQSSDAALSSSIAACSPLSRTKESALFLGENTPCRKNGLDYSRSSSAFKSSYKNKSSDDNFETVASDCLQQQSSDKPDMEITVINNTNVDHNTDSPHMGELTRHDLLEGYAVELPSVCSPNSHGASESYKSDQGIITCKTGSGQNSFAISPKAAKLICHKSSESGGPSSPESLQSPCGVLNDGNTSSYGVVHKFFHFCCSMYTGRVYIFNESAESLEANFLPLDVELGNLNDLPSFLHHPHHLHLLQTFVRQWNSLTDTKRHLIRKKGVMFRNPLAAYDTVRTDQSNNRQRYKTKDDGLIEAIEKAGELKGYIRKISKNSKMSHIPVISCTETSSPTTDKSEILSGTNHDAAGTFQVLSASGDPLCLQCQKPCTNFTSSMTVSKADHAWKTRFCSYICADAYWMKTSTSYIRSTIYDIQHGVCQLCQFDAHSFFCRIRDTNDHKKRAEMINQSKFARTGVDRKKQMITKPSEGLFWHVDHIRPVWEGGGQCDIDNLRTLCTPCHLLVTSRQAGKCATTRRLSSAARSGDITAFFKKS